MKKGRSERQRRAIERLRKDVPNLLIEAAHTILDLGGSNSTSTQCLTEGARQRRAALTIAATERKLASRN